MATSTASSSSPSAACKFFRHKCTSECVFTSYFSPNNLHKFANVHKIFNTNNITKLLNELPTHQRKDIMKLLAYEAEARIKDPVYRCVGAISVLQRQMAQLQNNHVVAHSDLARYTGAGMVVHRNDLTQDQLIADLSSREHLMELARVGGRSYKASLAGLGLSKGLCLFSFSNTGPRVESSNRSGNGGRGVNDNNAKVEQMSSP